MRKYLLYILLVGFWGCEDTKTFKSEPINPITKEEYDTVFVRNSTS